MPLYFTGDKFPLTSSTTITHYTAIRNGKAYINLLNGLANSTGLTLNPHINTEQIITLGVNLPLRSGDIITLHSDNETYDATIDTYNPSAATVDGLASGAASINIFEVEDPIVYPSTRIDANTTNVQHSGNDALIILPDDGNAPTQTFLEADYDDIFQSWSINAIGADGTSISFSFSVSGVVDDVPLGFDGISFNHTNRHFIFHFEDAGGNTAGENSSAFGELFDGSTDLVGTGDHFFLEFSYHDHDAITEYSWSKPYLVGGADNHGNMSVAEINLSDEPLGVAVEVGDNVATVSVTT